MIARGSVGEAKSLGCAGKQRSHSGPFAFAALRDVLLPELISDEVRVKNNERFLEVPI
jgi:hypothetical protein